MPTQVNFVPRPAQVAEGLFDADMKVSLVNDGPVTIVLDSAVAP